MSCASEILARQIAAGIVPEGTTLAENPDYIPKWETLSDDAKQVYARQMEVYATLVESADHEVGRLVDAIEDLGELDNTLFIYIAGDNGGSSIGEINGTFVEWSALNSAAEDVPYLKSRLDEYGARGLVPELLGRVGRRRFDARDVVHPDGAWRWQHGGHGRALAEGDRLEGRHPPPVRERHRHRADDS